MTAAAALQKAQATLTAERERERQLTQDLETLEHSQGTALVAGDAKAQRAAGDAVAGKRDELRCQQIKIAALSESILIDELNAAAEALDEAEATLPILEADFASKNAELENIRAAFDTQYPIVMEAERAKDHGFSVKTARLERYRSLQDQIGARAAVAAARFGRAIVTPTTDTAVPDSSVDPETEQRLNAERRAKMDAEILRTSEGYGKSLLAFAASRG
jgi:hypothetical protein